MQLKQWLAESGMSPKTLAKKIGSSIPSVYRYRNGDRIPDQKRMEKIYLITRGLVKPTDFYQQIAKKQDRVYF